MRYIKIIANICVLLFAIVNLSNCLLANKNTSQLDFAIDSLFQANYPGCLVIYNEKDNELFVFDSTRAAKRYSPASTFKIFNTLLAFETNTAKDSSYLIEWDGVQRDIPSWNSNHTLNTAFKNSVVWYYQKLAVKMGREIAQKYLSLCQYGNMKIGENIERYWLDTSLQISAFNQIEFLRSLNNDSLPFSISAMHKTKEIMLQDTSFGKLFYKTGLSLKQKVGWFVGWQEYNGNTYYFALNISYNQVNSLFIESRKKMVMDALKLYHKLY
jgi:beta-lactamase class D